MPPRFGLKIGVLKDRFYFKTFVEVSITPSIVSFPVIVMNCNRFLWPNCVWLGCLSTAFRYIRYRQYSYVSKRMTELFTTVHCVLRILKVFKFQIIEGLFYQTKKQNSIPPETYLDCIMTDPKFLTAKNSYRVRYFKIKNRPEKCAKWTKDYF